MSVFNDQLGKMINGKGFIAALDQSGGSTPKALEKYGVMPDEYNGEQEMFEKIHEMRTRIITDESFTSDRILGAILFEKTMRSMIGGKSTALYLWEEKGVVPFLKIDKGLAEERDGVQMMKDFGEYIPTLQEAKELKVFGTKMRSVIHTNNESGIDSVVTQQFDRGLEILNAGLIPIIEPEVNIHSPKKSESETILKEKLLMHLDRIPENQYIILKLTLPEIENFYAELISHPRVVRVVALSGGYSSEEANRRLSENKGMIASFSRALTEKIAASQSDQQFTETLDASIESIFQASLT